MSSIRGWLMFGYGLLLLIAAPAFTAIAQKKVVVIPLMEDARPLEPLAPLAPADPSDTDYEIVTVSLGSDVLDKRTHLIWQREDDDIKRNWSDAWEFCNELETGFLGSIDNWRLPTIRELLSIVDYSATGPAINTTAFPETNEDDYWSSSTLAFNTDRGWVVRFGIGVVGINYKDTDSDKSYVRCVRKPLVEGSHLKNNGDGTVTDLATGLTWQRQRESIKRKWAQAGSYCGVLNLGNKTDWRLPNIKELQSIVDITLHNPAIDADKFPGVDALGYYYWSATTLANSEDAWYVKFDTGTTFHADKQSDFYVRCVR